MKDVLSAKDLIESARRAAARADDPTLWWHRDSAGGVSTHVLRSDGTWSLYRQEGDSMREVASGRDST